MGVGNRRYRCESGRRYELNRGRMVKRVVVNVVLKRGEVMGGE